MGLGFLGLAINTCHAPAGTQILKLGKACLGFECKVQEFRVVTFEVGQKMFY